MYKHCADEDQYKDEAYEIISRFNYNTQQRAVIAIQDLFDSEHEISWQFIATALKKKSKDNYETYGFGIWFNKRFIASVLNQIKRDKRAKNIEVSKFFDDYDDDDDLDW